MLNLKKTIQVAFTLTLVGWATPVLSSSAHILIDVRGNVQVKKAQWKDFIEAESGNILSGKDKVMLGNNASVTVYCSDLNQQTVEESGTYLISEVCPEGDPVIRLCPDCNNDRLRPYSLKEEKLKELPYLISPRDTYVFNEPLTIRWNEVSGAANYTVKVEGEEEEWEKETNKTQILYDGKLKFGVYYILTVVADNAASSREEDDSWYSNFIVLEDDKAKTLREQVAVIKQQELTQEQKGLVLAYFYRGNKLNFEAIQVLEGLVKSGSQTARVYQLLGDIYQQVGLSLMAKEVYQQGLALTLEDNKSEIRAIIQWGLGKVEYFLGNGYQALEWLEKARENYLALGTQLNKQEKKLINEVLERN